MNCQYSTFFGGTMKIKKILIMSIVVFLVFLIYLTTIDKKIYLLTLSTNTSLDLLNTIEEKKDYNKLVNNYLSKKDILEKNINSYIESTDRITDIIDKVEENYVIEIDNKKQTIKNALIKADLLTIDIGINELQTKLLLKNNTNEEIYEYIDELMTDYSKLLELLREYCKEDIILIGYYSSDYQYEKFINYFNERLNNVASEYEIIFIDTNELYQNSALTYETEEIDIASQIIKVIEEVLLN